MKATAENIDDLLGVDSSEISSGDAVDMSVATPENIDQLLSETSQASKKAYSVDYGELERQRDEEELTQRLGNMEVSIGPWDTGYRWSDVWGGEDTAAAVVGMGHMMMDTWRGFKQIASFDVEEEKVNEAYMRELYASDEYGTEAKAGAFVGAVADPVGLIPGGLAAKAVSKTRVFEKAGNVGKAILIGSATGAAQTGTGYVDEEGGSTRAMQTGMGAGFGAGFGWLGSRFIKELPGTTVAKQAREPIERLEEEVGVRVVKGKNIAEALHEIREEMPDVISASRKATDSTGYVPDLANAGRNYEIIQEAKKGLKPVDTINRKTTNSVGNSVDKLIGVVSARVKDVSPRAFGKLRKYDAAISFRPEKYEKIRRPFAELFPTNTGRTSVNPAKTLEAGDVQILNGYLINGKFDLARSFLRKRRGDSAVTAFDDSLKVFKELGEEMQSLGVVNKMQDNYWHRAIRWDTREEFMDLLKKDMGRDLNEEWLKKLASLNKTSIERKGHELSELEQATALQNFLFKEGDDITTNGLAKSRRIKQVKKAWVKYYEDPIEAMDSYIHRAVGEIEKAKFFGEEAYQAGLKNSKEIEGLFNLDKTLEQVKTTSMFKDLDFDDQESLTHLLKLRFGHGSASANLLTSRYKALVNITLLGNPIAAMTQFGDLGMAMYKNGIRRTARALLKRTQGKESRVTIEDLGLEQRFTEFEDLAKLKSGSEFDKNLLKLQDRLFDFSGFSWVDRIGKETLVNGALDKSLSKATSKGPEYTKWAAKLKRTMGTDFDDLVSDLRKYAADPKKENVTDNIKAHLFSELADVQPISKSEMPEYYLTSNVGKTAFTLKTFMIKQIDLLRNEVLNSFKEGKPVEASANLIKYMGILGTTNLGADVVKDMVMGKRDMADLPEDVQALTVSDMVKNVAGSTLKTFGLSPYTIAGVEKEGVKGYASSLIPPLPIADELAKIALNISQGDEVPDYPKKRLLQYIPLAGRPLADRIMADSPSIFEESSNLMTDDESILEEEVSTFAEGGEVKEIKDKPKLFREGERSDMPVVTKEKLAEPKVYEFAEGGEVSPEVDKVQEIPLEESVAPDKEPYQKKVNRALASAVDLDEEGIEWAKKLGKEWGTNQVYGGKGDAARHAALGWLASRTDNPLTYLAIQAKEFGDAFTSSDARADVINNSVGYNIEADTFEAAEIIIKRMIDEDTGDLKFNPEGEKGLYKDKDKSENK